MSMPPITEKMPSWRTKQRLRWAELQEPGKTAEEHFTALISAQGVLVKYPVISKHGEFIPETTGNPFNDPTYLLFVAHDAHAGNDIERITEKMCPKYSKKLVLHDVSGLKLPDIHGAEIMGERKIRSFSRVKLSPHLGRDFFAQYQAVASLTITPESNCIHALKKDVDDAIALLLEAHTVYESNGEKYIRYTPELDRDGSIARHIHTQTSIHAGDLFERSDNIFFDTEIDGFGTGVLEDKPVRGKLVSGQVLYKKDGPPYQKKDSPMPVAIPALRVLDGWEVMGDLYKTETFLSMMLNKLELNIPLPLQCRDAPRAMR